MSLSIEYRLIVAFANAFIKRVGISKVTNACLEISVSSLIMTEERGAFGAAPSERVGPWLMRITHPDRLQCTARRNSPFGRGAAVPVSAGTSFRSRCANVVSAAKLLWKRNCGRKRMSIKGRTSGAARSIRVASRQRGLSGPGLERRQNGFTSSSNCNTIFPQRVLRNLNFPVSAMALSCRTANLCPQLTLEQSGSGRFVRASRKPREGVHVLAEELTIRPIYNRGKFIVRKRTVR